VPLLVCFGAFVLTFLTTRTITRMIRAGKGPFHDNVSDSGLHVHHAVPGIILLVIGAFLAVGTGASDTAWDIVAALLVGVGTSLVLDEFALILHLQDVCWADEGRISVEMGSLAMACLGLAFVGLTPSDFSGFEGGLERALIVGAVVAAILGLIVVSVMKGKYKLASSARSSRCARSWPRCDSPAPTRGGQRVTTGPRSSPERGRGPRRTTSASDPPPHG